MGLRHDGMAMAAAVALAAWPGIAPAQTPVAGAGANGAALCIVRNFAPGLAAPGAAPTLVVWVSVPQPTRVSIVASAQGDGPRFARFAIEVMRDGVRLGGAEGVADDGAMAAHLATADDLVPGRQYRFVARTAMRDTRLTQMRLAITSGVGCA